MIVMEFLSDALRVRQYSDTGHIIRQVETGKEYYDAVDVIPCQYTYEETDMVIPRPKPDEHED